MKKILALLLSLLMVVGMLVACGGSEDSKESDGTKQTTTEAPTEPEETPTEPEEKPTEPEEDPTEPEEKPTEPEVITGELLEAPEVTFNKENEDLYIMFQTAGESEEETQMISFAVDQLTEDDYILYFCNGALFQDEEMIFEVQGESITPYAKNAFMDNYELVTDKTQEENETAISDIWSIVGMFVYPEVYFEGAKYQKTEETAYSLCGDVYTYNVVADGKVAYKIHVHKETGIVTYLTDAAGNLIFQVWEVSTTELPIPEYK